MLSYLKGLFKPKILPPYPVSSVVWSSNRSGFANGVVIPSEKNNKFITARHWNTPIMTSVHLVLDNGTTFDTVVVNKVLPDVQVTKTKLADKPENDRHWYGDIAICEVKDPFPITPLEIGDISSGKIFVQHKDKIWKEHTVGYEKLWGQLLDLPSWIRTLWGKENFKQGDSGLPWFSLNKKTNKWMTVGITSRTSLDPNDTPWSGEAPRLGSKKFKTIIESYTSN